MSMEDIVITADRLSKVYHLYSSPLQMFLHKMGLGFLSRQKPGQHAALANVCFQIKKGEKVAFIGRNGAGKSTLLKLISGVSEATSGSLKVNGEVHALLSIGSGFHQDFTGRENVYAYLANQGISGKRADEFLEEIVEFAEVEEYIDQPLRTYSTGMGVRLMFATSTIIAPEILILDEVLGVGDAYFAQKSYDRMREMASSKGTTLLLVTHDIYSAVNFCERVIWIDKGQILMDGSAKEVVAAYENSVKIQEEERLRIKNMKKSSSKEPAKLSSTQAVLTAGEDVLIEIRPGNEMYFETTFCLAEIELYCKDKLIASWGANDKNATTFLVHEGSQWSELREIEGVNACGIKDCGNPFHKVALKLPLSASVIDESEIFCYTKIYSKSAVSFSLCCHAGDLYLASEAPFLSPGGWHTDKREILCTGRPIHAGQDIFYGTAAIILSDFRCVQHGKETLICEPGEPLEVLIDYEIKDKEFCCTPDLAIVFAKDGICEVSRSLCKNLYFSYAQSKKGTIKVLFPKFHLGCGEYSISALIGVPDYYEKAQKYFSINEDVYMCAPRAKDIVVRGGSAFARVASVVEQAEFSMSSKT